MYASFFGLKQPPFSIAPDPRYLYMSERHREALAHLLYGVKGGGGFVLLTGEIGAGKTTVCRCFLEQIPKRCNVAYVFNPKLTVLELLRTICDEFRIPFGHEGPGAPTVKDYVDALNHFLLQTHAVGQNNVLIIDEAQNLSADVLEQLRLLTNLETSERKLLQIILIGQPELRTMLARPELEQLGQRVIARFHLDALTEKETALYVKHRLVVAGMKGANPFERSALQRIHALTRGVPRRINLLCDRAMLGAYALGRPRVDREIVEKAAQEVFDTPARVPRRRLVAWGAAAGVAGLVAVLAVLAMTQRRGPAAEAGAAVPAKLASAAASAPLPAAPAASALSLAAAAPAASAPPAPPPAPLDLPADFATLGSDEAAGWRALAERWNLAPDDGDTCVAAQRQQLQCYRGTGASLTLLRQLDRPVLLLLRDTSGRPGYAVLSALGPVQALLRVGKQERSMSLVALEQAWRGEFATFWRTPPGYAGTIDADSSGPAADWLAERMAALPAGLLPASTGRSLTARIRAFQTTQGLLPDGRAGPVTLMQLNRLAGVDEPRLQTPR
ncbi:ExeA family protein [Piscinibacter defluvii]|uniref:ExeA family protein n=1 Tax=Piscinibacter defluvii TaxID=1796922 RepID=UPI000FDE1D8B|nr:ExeA family protein [Piscinibacter defluvii]